ISSSVSSGRGPRPLAGAAPGLAGPPGFDAWAISSRLYSFLKIRFLFLPAPAEFGPPPLGAVSALEEATGFWGNSILPIMVGPSSLLNRVGTKSSLILSGCGGATGLGGSTSLTGSAFSAVLGATAGFGSSGSFGSTFSFEAFVAFLGGSGKSILPVILGPSSFTFSRCTDSGSVASGTGAATATALPGTVS